MLSKKAWLWSSARMVLSAAESWFRTTCSLMESFLAMSAMGMSCSLFHSKISRWRGESFCFACIRAVRKCSKSMLLSIYSSDTDGPFWYAKYSSMEGWFNCLRNSFSSRCQEMVNRYDLNELSGFSPLRFDQIRRKVSCIMSSVAASDFT